MLDDRPDIADASAPLMAAVTVKRGMGSWRLASRLARREVRHRWVRSLIVVLLIAVPVAGMAIADMGHRADLAPYSNQSSFGTAVAALYFQQQPSPAVVDQDFRELVAPALPAGTIVLWTRNANVPLRLVGSTAVVFADVSDVDLRGPLAQGMVSRFAGRVPGAAGEVWLSRRVARSLGVGVGDSFTLVHPSQTFKVVGVGQVEGPNGEVVEIDAPGFDFSALRPGITNQTVLLGGPAWKDHPVESANAVRAATGLAATFDGTEAAGAPAIAQLLQPFTSHPGDGAFALARGWVYGTLAMAVLGVIVAAAFAVSGRRQLVTVGQLSAQGASAPTIRRFLGLQGSVSGVGGAVIGVIAGRVIWLAVTSDTAHGRDAAISVRDLAVIAGTAIVVATAAALVPARSLTRVSVLTALGGRRPVGAVPRWMIPLGVLLSAGGLGAVLLVAASAGRFNTGPSSALVGALGTGAGVAGLCCLSPLIVEWAARLAARRPGTARLAARSLVRHRSRSSALLAAIIAIGAAGVALGSLGESAVARSNRAVPSLPTNVVEAMSYPVVPTMPGAATVPVGNISPSTDPLLADPDIERHITDVVGAVAWIRTEQAVDADTALYLAAMLGNGNGNDPSGQGGVAGAARASTVTGLPVKQPFRVSDSASARVLGYSAFVASDQLLDLLRIDAGGRAALQQRGAVFFDSRNSWVTDPSTGRETPMKPVIETSDPTTNIAIPDIVQRVHVFDQDFLVLTRSTAQQLGLQIVRGPLFAVTAQAITSTQREALTSNDVYTRSAEAATYLALPLPDHSLSVNATARHGDKGLLYRSLITVSALALVLLVVAFGLALFAAEGRDEQRMLSTIGASPQALTRMTAWRSLILTLTGTILAVPIGYGVVALIARVSNAADYDSAPFPWIVAGAIAIGIPLVVTGAGYAVSSLGHRRRRHGLFVDGD